MIQPVTVYGGYQNQRVTWYRNADEDWDCDYDLTDDLTVYPTRDAALAALETTT